MSIQLNHTIVWCRDKRKSSAFVAHILGTAPPLRFYNFMVVKLANDVSLDFMETSGTITQQHYAFLVSESEFDAAFARIREARVKYWADPMRSCPDEINHNDGGRGVYFADLDDHQLELITRPYGG